MASIVQPLVLLACADQWLGESLESVLTQGGYHVIATAARHEILELARQHRPDVVLLDLGFDRRASDPFALCRALRAEVTIPATPIVLITAGAARRSQQIDALRAGAWELRGDPLDLEELVLRIGAYVRGKIRIDQHGADAMLDGVSGLYNEAGLVLRSGELAAFTARHGMPLACAVFRPAENASAQSLNGDEADRLAVAFKEAGRASDAVGRTGPVEFTVFAPATDETGAEGLVQRISDAVAHHAAIKLRAGISTAPAPPTSGRGSGAPPLMVVPPAELFHRARAALVAPGNQR
jgi:DNA-binding response OmpR family regulator